MRIQVTINDIAADQLGDIIEAFGDVTVKSGQPGRFNVTTRWNENDLHWLAQQFEHADRYVYAARTRMEQLCQQRYRSIGWSDADLAEIAAYRAAANDPDPRRQWMLRRLEEADQREAA